MPTFYSSRRIIRTNRHSRRGATLVLFAVMLVVLLAMVVFAIDIGYICLTRTQLQAAADSAALAAAVALGDGGDQSRANAVHYAGLHAAAHESIAVVASDDVSRLRETRR